MSLVKNWNEEQRSAFLYRLLANQEKNSVYKNLFLDLATGAEKQAAIWARNMQKTGETVPTKFKPDLRTLFVAGLIQIFPPKQLRFILSAMKVRGMSVYSTPTASASDATTHLETRHRSITLAGNLRAAVFGVNDGLVSNVSLMLGVVGANANHHFIVLSGVAGLLAGACSMAAGEFISVRSQREFFEYQIELEREELELYPEEEAEELASIYTARGLSKEDAKQLAERMIHNPAVALDTLAREELGLNPQELGSPLGAAISSFLAFAFGAFIPLVPFLLTLSDRALTISIVLTAIALASIGALISLFTNRSAVLSGLRMLAIGSLAGAITYLIGMLVGT